MFRKLQWYNYTQAVLTKEFYMRLSVCATVDRCVSLVKSTVKIVNLDGQVWYDITDEGLEAEIKLLRVSGIIAHHPLVRTLIRFGEE